MKTNCFCSHYTIFNTFAGDVHEAFYSALHQVHFTFIWEQTTSTREIFKLYFTLGQFVITSSDKMLFHAKSLPEWQTYSYLCNWDFLPSSATLLTFSLCNLLKGTADLTHKKHRTTQKKLAPLTRAFLMNHCRFLAFNNTTPDYGSYAQILSHRTRVLLTCTRRVCDDAQWDAVKENQ